jgi:hypothetical protein
MGISLHELVDYNTLVERGGPHILYSWCIALGGEGNFTVISFLVVPTRCVRHAINQKCGVHSSRQHRLNAEEYQILFSIGNAYFSSSRPS